MHYFNVGSSADMNQICLEASEFLDIVKLTKAEYIGFMSIHFVNTMIQCSMSS
jgi:hypothetical protein